MRSILNSFVLLALITFFELVSAAPTNQADDDDPNEIQNVVPKEAIMLANYTYIRTDWLPRPPQPTSTPSTLATKTKASSERTMVKRDNVVDLSKLGSNIDLGNLTKGSTTTIIVINNPGVSQAASPSPAQSPSQTPTQPQPLNVALPPYPSAPTPAYINPPLPPQTKELYTLRQYNWIRCRTRVQPLFDVGGPWVGDNGKRFFEGIAKHEKDCIAVNKDVSYVNKAGWGDATISFNCMVYATLPQLVEALKKTGEDYGKEHGRKFYIYNCEGHTEPYNPDQLGTGLSGPYRDDPAE